MTLAHRLASLGHELSVFEASPEWGGLAAAWNLDGIVWDRFYHVTLASDSYLIRLLADLGLDQSLRWTRTRTGFYTGAGFFPMSNAVDFLRLPLAGPAGKLRLAATLWSTSRRTNWKALEHRDLEDYLRCWSGDHAFETIWLPLLRAKLGDNYRRVSAAFIWAVIRRLMAARNSGLKTEQFGYVAGGYERVLSSLCQALASSGVSLNLNHAVTSIGRTAGRRLSVGFGSGRNETFDRVIVTFPSPSVARVCQILSEAEREAFGRVEYVGIVCASLVMRRPLSDHYLTYITDASSPFTGVVEMSNLVDPAQFGGHALVYLPKYVPPDDPLFDTHGEVIRASWLDSLQQMYPGFRKQDVLQFRIARQRRVFALPVLGYSQMLPPMRTSVEGLHVVNSSYIVNGTLNVNETVGLAEQYAASC